VNSPLKRHDITAAISNAAKPNMMMAVIPAWTSCNTVARGNSMTRFHGVFAIGCMDANTGPSRGSSYSTTADAAWATGGIGTRRTMSVQTSPAALPRRIDASEPTTARNWADAAPTAAIRRRRTTTYPSGEACDPTRDTTSYTRVVSSTAIGVTAVASAPRTMSMSEVRRAALISGQSESEARVRTPDAAQSSTSAWPGPGDSRRKPSRAASARRSSGLRRNSTTSVSAATPAMAARMALAFVPSMLATSRAARSRCSLASRVADSDICRCTTAPKDATTAAETPTIVSAKRKRSDAPGLARPLCPPLLASSLGTAVMKFRGYLGESGGCRRRAPLFGTTHGAAT
jgi:hypothetical protein